MITLGNAVPDFEASSTGDKTVKLSDYQGKYLIIYFTLKTIRPVVLRKAKVFAITLKNSPHSTPS
jgi:AhpC/TSA family.